MSDLLSKALLSGLGLANLTKDAIQKTAEDLVKKSNLSEEEGRRLVKQLHQRTAKAQKDMEKTVETAVNKLLKNVHLAVVHIPAKGTKPAAKTRAKATKKKSSKK